MIIARLRALVVFSMLLTAVVGFSYTGFAQDAPVEEEKPSFRFDDDQLIAFFDANQEISVVQKEIAGKITETIEKHGLTPERFRQIGSAAQIGALDGGSFTPEEIEAFNTVAPLVTGIQREQQSMVQALLAEKGMTTQQYQEIINDFRQDQNLQAYVRELVRERAIEEVREERRRQREQEAAEGAQDN